MKILVDIDLAQAEWVVTGFEAQDPRMIDVYINNRDPHATTGQLVTKAPLDFIARDAEIIGHLNDQETIQEKRLELMNDFPHVDFRGIFLPRTMSIRQCGKKANHGLNYLLGYKNFALHNEITESESKIICETYRNRAYRRLPLWYAEIEKQIRKNRTLENCFGDKRKFLGPINDELIKQATAWKPQSTVARLTKFGMNGVYYDNWKWMRKATEIRAQVHDSLATQVEFDSPSMLAAIARRLRMHFSEPCCCHQREFIIRSDFKIGFFWGEDSMIEVVETGDLENDIAVALEKALAEKEQRLSGNLSEVH